MTCRKGKLESKKRSKMTIKELRQKAGLTQLELADLTGIDGPQLSRIERGERNAGPKSLKRIAAALDVPIALLVQPNFQQPNLKKVHDLDGGIDLYVDERFYKDMPDWDVCSKEITTHTNAPFLIRGDRVYANRNDKDIFTEGLFLFRFGVQEENIYCAFVMPDPSKLDRFHISYHDPNVENIGWVNMDDIEVIGRVVRVGREINL